MSGSLGALFTPAALLAHDGGVRNLRTHCKERRASSAPRRLRRLREFASAHRATNPSPDPDRCSQMHRCLAVPVPTLRLRDSLSECYITGRCLPAMTPRVLVMGDEVRTEENFFRWTITINSFTGRSLSARLQGSVRFLAIPIPAPPSIRLTVDLPSTGSDTGLSCSVDMTQ